MSELRAIVPDGGVRGGKNRSGASIPTKRIVKLDTNASNVPDAVLLGAAATDTLYGVSMETIADKANGDIQVSGTAIVETGATAVTVGSRVTTDASGRAVPAAPAAGTNNGIIGIALTASTGAGQFVEVALLGPGASYQG